MEKLNGIEELRDYHNNKRLSGGFYEVDTGSKEKIHLPCGDASVLLFIPENGLDIETLEEHVQVVPEDISYKKISKHYVIEMIKDTLEPNGLVRKGNGNKYIRTEKANKGIYEHYRMDSI